MEKKRVLFTASFLSILVCSWVVGTRLFDVGKANPLPNQGIEITLKSPKNITYDENTIPVILTATQFQFHLPISGISLSYSLDDKERKPILNVTVTEGSYPSNPTVYSKTVSGYLVLFNLSEGWHKITVYSQTHKITIYSLTIDVSGTYVDDDTIDFFVDTIPILSFLSFENKTFETSDVPLNFTVNQPVSQITYCLDGQENVTINGNNTLTNLPSGEHNVTVYATDNVGNIGASETVTFTIAEPEPEPFATTLVVASVITVAVVGIGMLVYFKKCKR